MPIKWLKLGLVFGVSSILIACSHSNPLKKAPPTLAGNFLFQASYVAEKQLNAGEAHGGSDYGTCVAGSAVYSAYYCQQLYQGMVKFAKEQAGYFKAITVDDLTDADAYFKVKSYYDNQRYLIIAQT